MLATLRSLTPRKHLGLLSLIAAAALSFAWTLQYAFGLPPCELCLWQRKPYLAAAILGALFWLATPRAPKLATPALWILLLCFLTATATAAYHSGVEYGIFKGLSGCSSNLSTSSSIEDLRAAILGAPVVSCNQPMAEFLGLSLASWNALYALLASGLTLLCLRHQRS